MGTSNIYKPHNSYLPFMIAEVAAIIATTMWNMFIDDDISTPDNQQEGVCGAYQLIGEIAVPLAKEVCEIDWNNTDIPDFWDVWVHKRAVEMYKEKYPDAVIENGKFLYNKPL